MMCVTDKRAYEYTHGDIHIINTSVPYTYAYNDTFIHDKYTIETW